MQSKMPQRAVIHAKDVMNITGYSDRNARRLLQDIRKAVGKLDDQLVTVQEFCFFTGIEEETVRMYLKC